PPEPKWRANFRCCACLGTMNPPLTPPRRGTERTRTNTSSPPGRGRGWVGSGRRTTIFPSFCRLRLPACAWISRMMRSRIVFITGTDTGVGKTVLTTVLTSCLRDHGLRVAALKPICSGGREDARVLRRLLDGAMTLQEINPWNFRAPLAPLLAARRERTHVKAADV